MRQSQKLPNTIKWLLESTDGSGATGMGVIPPNIPTSGPGENQVEQEPLPDIHAIVSELEIDRQIQGNEDPIKRFIDKLVDTKNKLFTDGSNREIEQLTSKHQDLIDQTS